MFEKLTPELITWVLVLLVPGFLLRYALGFFVTPRENSESRNWLTMVAFSGFNFLPLMIWFGAKGKIPYVSGWGQFLLAILLVFIWPFLMAYLLALGIEKEWLRRWAKAWGLNPKRIEPSAWDYQFRKPDACWLLVRLKDGGEVLGLYQDDSIAGSTDGERDLFIEKQYVLTANGEWAEKERSRGILIKADQIAWVEFRE